VIIANTAALYCALQIGACAFLFAYDRTVPALLAPDPSDAAARNYTHLSPEDVAALHAATRRQRFRYEPGIGLVQSAITSPLLNVDAHSIRSNGSGHRPIAALDAAIWFLGGSTTFGESIADSETIPAQLERAISKPVINLGVPGYASSMENTLLVHYLRLGYRPSLALFLDGINETCEPELYDEEMKELFRIAQLNNYWDVGGPVVRALRRAARKYQKIAGVYQEGKSESLVCSRDGKENSLAVIHSRILEERAALCGAYQIDCRTLVQPFAGTHGPTQGLPEAFMATEANFLRDLFHHLEPGWRAAGAVFVSDALDRYDRHPFVDDMHYSADASRVIAEAIATRLALR
jgi:hypothetical protein